MEKLVRLVCWVKPAQKKKVSAKAKAKKKRDPRASESAIIRGLIDKM
jgi:hypothetical protein